MDPETANHPATKLVQYVARAFFDDLAIVILDQLLIHEKLQENQIASKLKVPPKDVSRTMGHLKSFSIVDNSTSALSSTVTTRVIDQVTQNKTTIVSASSKYGSGAGASKGTATWFINFKQFHDSVKLRFFYVQKLCEKASERKMEFMCMHPGCGFRYEEMDMIGLTDMATGMVTCRYCGSEVDEVAVSENYDGGDNIDGGDDGGGETLAQKFEKQFRPILECLREMESLVIPANTSLQTSVANILTKEEAEKEIYNQRQSSQRSFKMGGHMVAGVGGAGGAGGAVGKGSIGGGSGPKSSCGAASDGPVVGGLGSTGHGNQLNQGTQHRLGGSMSSSRLFNDGRTVVVRSTDDDEDYEDLMLMNSEVFMASSSSSQDLMTQSSMKAESASSAFAAAAADVKTDQLPDFLAKKTTDDEQKRLLELERIQQKRREEQLKAEAYNALLARSLSSSSLGGAGEEQQLQQQNVETGEAGEEGAVEGVQPLTIEAAEIVYVSVAGQLIPMDEVTPGDIQNMTNEEYDDYTAKLPQDEEFY